MRTIEVILDQYQLNSWATRWAAAEAFGLDQPTMVEAFELKLLATLEQFGLFVALRNAYGGSNAIKALKPQLIMHPRHVRIDCTTRRAA